MQPEELQPPLLVASREMTRPELSRYSCHSTSFRSLSSSSLPLRASKKQQDKCEAPRAQMLKKCFDLPQNSFMFGSVAVEKNVKEKEEEEEEKTMTSDNDKDSSRPDESHLYGYSESVSPRGDVSNYTESVSPGAMRKVVLEDSEALSTSSVSRLDKFHEILLSLKSSKKESFQSVEEKIARFSALVSLTNDFVRDAQTYGKLILSELLKERKTIAPCGQLGVLGGEKFIVAGIYFKLARDKSDLLGGWDGAEKVARHELKCLAALMDANVEGLRCPLMAIVSFCGMSLIAMTELPISGDQTLVYGSSDGGKTFVNRSPEAEVLAQEVGRKLHLKQHHVKSSGQLQISTPADMEIHFSEGSYYALDFSRLMPPTVPNRSIPGCVYRQLFRPEFVQSHPTPLNSDAWSNFLASKEDLSQSKLETREAMQRLENNIVQFAQFLSKRPLPKSSNDHQYAVQTVVHFMHAEGINVRYLGRIRNLLPADCAYWRFRVLVSLVVRRLLSAWTSRVRRCFLGGHGVSGCMRETVSFYNQVFGLATPTSVALWDAALVEVHEYFGEQDDLRELAKDPSFSFRSYMFSSERSKALGHNVLLRIFTDMTRRFGLKLAWDPSVIEYFTSLPDALLAAAPFGEQDLLDLPVRTRSLPIVSFCQAKELQLRAIVYQSQSLSHAWNLNWRAASHFNAALRALVTGETLRNFATCLHLVDEFENANDLFALSLRFGQDPKTLFRMANAADAEFDFERAETLYLQSLQRAPNPHRLCVYADFLADRGLFEPAVACYKASLHLCVTSEAQANLGTLLMTRSPSEAWSLLRAALSNAPDARTRGRILRNMTYFARLQNVKEPPASDQDASHGPLMFLAVDATVDVPEMRRALGNARRFLVRCFPMATPLSQTSVHDAVIAKTRQAYRICHYPCAAELIHLSSSTNPAGVILTPDVMQAHVLLAQLGGPGKAATVTCFVGYTEGGDEVSVFQSSLEGNLVAVDDVSSGWTSIFSVKGYGRTLQQLKELVSVRQAAYLSLWIQQIEK